MRPIGPVRGRSRQGGRTPGLRELHDPEPALGTHDEEQSARGMPTAGPMYPYLDRVRAVAHAQTAIRLNVFPRGATQSPATARAITTRNSATLPAANSKIPAARTYSAVCHAHEDRHRHALAILTPPRPARRILPTRRWHPKVVGAVQPMHRLPMGLRTSTSSANSDDRSTRGSVPHAMQHDARDFGAVPLLDDSDTLEPERSNPNVLGKAEVDRAALRPDVMRP